jgi:response regulator RpfG family c-di-GMP phosphodiesterase
MTGDERAKILLVDDDRSTLNIITKVLSSDRTFQVHGATSGAEGLRLAREIRPDIIISDYYMPEMDGFEFCQRVKGDEELSSTLFILLTAETKADTKVTGLEQGADDYIEKSTPPAVLISKIKAFLRIKYLQDELQREKQNLVQANELLERNFRELTAILLKILDVRIPGSADRSQTAKRVADHITGALDLDEVERKMIIFSAMLHEIGKIGLPDSVAGKGYYWLSAEERTVYHQYPVVGSIIISTITGFKEAANAIYSQLENYDGSGIPEGLMGRELSTGAKILRAIVFQEEVFRTGAATAEIVQQVKQTLNKALDPNIAELLIEYLRTSEKDGLLDKQQLGLDELKPGMIVAEDIYASSGVKLLPKGIALQSKMLQLLTDRASCDPIIGGVFVYK